MLSLLPRILSWGRLLLAGWWSLGVACVMPVLRLCRSLRGQATFGEAAVGGILSSSPALALLGGVVAPWRFLEHRPADSAALGIPRKSSPRQSPRGRC
jgi:hypothetical protein